MNKKPFTIADGIATQTEQLGYWKNVLNEKTFEALVAWATKYNVHPAVQTGYDITRGSDLSYFVSNVSIGHKPESLYQPCAINFNDPQS